MVSPRHRVHVCFGTPPGHLEFLEDVAAGTEKIDWWTINKSALPGDKVVFYMISPLSAFVATGVVKTRPKVVEDRKSHWYGKYAANMSSVKMLPRPVRISEAKERLPGWGFLRQPHKSLLIPAEFVVEFMDFLRQGDPSVLPTAADFYIYTGTVLEGALTTLPTTTRSRCDAAYSLAKEHYRGADGLLRCEACKWAKPSRVEADIVELHHRDPLAGAPEKGRHLTLDEAIRSLMPLCPNCHRIAHAKPGGGIYTLNELQDILTTNGAEGSAFSPAPKHGIASARHPRDDLAAT